VGKHFESISNYFVRISFKSRTWRRSAKILVRKKESL